MTGLQVWLHPSSRTIIQWSVASMISGQLTARFFWPLITDHWPLDTYTLRLLGGRQPLCGIGVTSRIERTSIPEAARARTADSRADPGPLTRTSTERRPWSR